MQYSTDSVWCSTVSVQMRDIPLDPNGGATAYLEIAETTEPREQFITFKFGTDPQQPTKEMTFNAVEMKTALSVLNEEFGGVDA